MHEFDDDDTSATFDKDKWSDYGEGELEEPQDPTVMLRGQPVRSQGKISSQVLGSITSLP